MRLSILDNYKTVIRFALLPLQYTLSVACLDGEISLQEMADRLDMDLITAQGCVDVVKGWRDTEAKALADAAKGDGIPF